MPLTGQASGGWTESSSALRILHVGVRNTVGNLTDDSFTQTNPPIITTAGTISTSPGALTEVLGVLSGSVAFTRPDAGSNFIGGPTKTAMALPASVTQVLPLGCFINSATGNPYENLPGVASGKGPYVAAMGTYGSRLFETQLLVATTGTVVAAGTALTYVAGQKLVASQNGYLMPSVVFNGAALVAVDNTAGGGAYNTLESVNAGAVVATTIGILKMAPDSVMNEIVFDQRI
jgi:hypothetical protein